eukprot:s2303_g3.t3
MAAMTWLVTATMLVAKVACDRPQEDLIFLNTTSGSQLLRSASHAEPYWQLSPHFVTELPGMCGPTTAIMMLNALAAQGLPAAVSEMYSYRSASFSQVYRYWDSQNVWNGSAAQCIKGQISPWQGSVQQIGGMLRCHGAKATVVEASRSSLEQFRQTLVEAFSDNSLRFVGVNFDRKMLGQRGAGHHSPIGAYDQKSDRALVMDVARYKYPPFWAGLTDVFLAMNSTAPEVFSTPRGYLVRKSQTMHVLGDTLASRTDELSPQNVTNVVHAFSRLSCYNVRLFQNLVTRVSSEDLKAYKLYELGVLCHNLAKLRSGGPTVYGAMFGELARRPAEDWEPKAVAQVLDAMRRRSAFSHEQLLAPQCVKANTFNLSMATLAARLSSGMLAPDAALRRRLLLCGQLLVGSAVLFPVVHDTFPRCFANSPPITRLRDCPTRRKCASSSIPLLLASSIDPADSEGLLKILGVGEGPRLAYIGTARTAPRKDSERPLKDQRKKRRYEARHRSKLLGEALGASSVENIFLEDMAKDSEAGARQLSNALKIALGNDARGILFVDGGNTFWLWFHAKQAGLSAALRELRASTSFAYVGVSAGAILSGRTCNTAYWKGWDDPTVVPSESLQESLDGLALTNQAVFPHYGPQWEETVRRCVGTLPPDCTLLCIDEENGKLLEGSIK